MKQLITGHLLATLLISACQPIHRPTSGKGQTVSPIWRSFLTPSRRSTCNLTLS